MPQSESSPNHIVVKLRNPDRTELVEGPAAAGVVLSRLGIHPDSVIVIKGDELVTKDEMLRPGDEVEIRPVVSGG
jgi:sulfur carrier protein